MKIVDDFFNKIAGEIDKTYFPDVKYYRDNKSCEKVHYAIVLFNNGCSTYDKLVTTLSKLCNEEKKVVESIVNKYVEIDNNSI